jgi:hypothetical protein
LWDFSLVSVREEKEIVLQRLEMAIEYAKQAAFIQQKIIRICPSVDYKTCSNQHWSHGFIIIDRGGNLLKVFPKLRYGTLQFSQFGTDLNIYPNGTTPNNGTFFYCPRLRDRREIDALVVNNIGRTYRPTKHPILGFSLKNNETPLATPFICW